VVFCDEISGNATIRHPRAPKARGDPGKWRLRPPKNTIILKQVQDDLDCFVALCAPRNDGFLSPCNNVT
jgi:hypothetical protein